MDNKHIVEYAKIDSVVSSGKPIIIVLFPNYEDRSTGLVTSLFKQNKLEIHAQIDFLLFCLKNRTNNNNLLEDLKDNNIDKIKKVLVTPNVHEFWLEYPSNFSPNSLKAIIQEMLESSRAKYGSSTDILLDISTTPKSVLFQLCECVYDFIQLGLVGKVFFSYCLPEEYSKVPYAQDIGLIKGLFSGEALHFSNEQAINAIVIPSRSGHEGKLLCDTLDSISKKTSYNVYFPIYTDDFIDSLHVLRANQTLIDRESYYNYFYCTLDDAIKTIDEMFYKEYIRMQQILKVQSASNEELETPPLTPQVYLVAPFGSKVFLPVAYFELLRLRSVDPELISIEIANVKGFQYTSSYSLGGGGSDDGSHPISITNFELNVEIFKNEKDFD